MSWEKGKPLGAFERERLLRPPFIHDSGFGWRVGLDDLGPADGLVDPISSAVYLFEDEKQLGPAHTLHRDIRLNGTGRFSHWEGVLYFSSSDNTDPNLNGRSYRAIFSPQLYFKTRADHAIGIVSYWLSRLPGGEDAVRGKTVLEVGPGRDMGTVLILAALGAQVSAADSAGPRWIPGWHCPFVEALSAGLKASPWHCDLSPLRRSLDADAFDPMSVSRLACAVEELPDDCGNRFEVVLSNSALEHVRDPRGALGRLYRSSRRDALGLHRVDFRDHRDFGHPLEFLILDDAQLELETGAVKYQIGNRARPSEYSSFFADAGFAVLDFEVGAWCSQDYVDDFIERLRRSPSAYRSTSPSDLAVAGGTFLVKRP